MPDSTWSHISETESGPLTCLPLTLERFGDMEKVFGDRGVARGCFCMHWRRPDGGYTEERDNRERFKDTALEGPPPGLIGYLDGNPVGWVQVGPRSNYPTLQRSRLFRAIDDSNPWSINCFVVKVGSRRQGVGSGLLEAAIEFASDSGAAVIEAYPVDGHRESRVDYFTGTLSMFSDRGFTEVIRRNDSRPIVRLTV